ncbi:MAG: hypothetical protein R2830_19355 [Saprospiraceae bacterium]
MQYKSSTLAIIRQLCAELYKSGIFPHAHSAEIAAIRGHEVEVIRNVMKGKPADLNAVRSVVEEAERLAKAQAPKVPHRSVRHLSITEIHAQSLLPSGFSNRVAELTDNSPSTIRSFLKNQRDGRTAYVSSNNILEALYEITEMNDEWELQYRLEKVLEKIKQKE